MISDFRFLIDDFYVIASRALALGGEAIPNIALRLLRAEVHCPRNDGMTNYPINSSSRSM